MKTSVTGSVIVLAISSAVVVGIAVAADTENRREPKHSIEQVMELAHSDGLLKKVFAGSATAEEKTDLLDLYISMLQCTPPRGDVESWNRLSGAAVIAAAKAVVGREDAAADLKKATNCAACHKAHKPKG